MNARDKNGGTPLHTAAQYNENPEVIIIFLAASTDGTAVNDVGETPFDLDKEKDVSVNYVGRTMNTKQPFAHWPPHS